MRPNARQAVRLQFHAYRKLVAGLGIALLQLANFALNASQLLNVMAYLVGQHVGLSKLAGRSEALRESLSAYGDPLGEVFQLRDDLLGAFGDEARAG